MNVLFIADFFRDQLPGGGESNDANLIHYLESREVRVDKLNSQDINPTDLNEYSKVIVGNFGFLSQESRSALIKKGNYIIYEHDHKYLTTRDPSPFVNFEPPSSKIINSEFYEGAQAVIVLSDICKKVLEKCIPKAAVHSIGCSLWSSETLDYIESLSNAEKIHDYCIMKSMNPTKNYPHTKTFCDSKGIQPLEIQNPEYYEFLRLMSEARAFIFLPKVLETFSRVCAEAKMLNLEVHTNKNLIGFYSEEYSSLKGVELIQKIREQNQLAYEYFYKKVIS
jgi:hypothetical protein